MLVGHLMGETEPETTALALVGARQGVEALEDPWQCVVGNAGAAVGDPKTVAILLKGAAESDQPVGGRKVDGVVQQVADGLLHQQRVPLLFRRAGQLSHQRYLPALGDNLAGIERPLAEPGWLYRLPIQPLPRLQPRQLQHPLDQLLHAGTLLIDVADKAPGHLGGRRFGQDLPCPANGGQRAFQLVGQAVDIALDIALAIELVAHGFKGVAEPIQLDGVQLRQRRRLPLADRFGIVHQFAYGAVEPPNQQTADQ